MPYVLISSILNPKCVNKFIWGQRLGHVIVSTITELMVLSIPLKIALAIPLYKSIIYFNSLAYTISQFNLLSVFLIASASQQTIIYYSGFLNETFTSNFLYLHSIHGLYWVPLAFNTNSSLYVVFLQPLQNTDIIIFVLPLSIYNKWVISLDKNW